MTPPRPPRVLLLCGGRSEEHEVSLASARSVLEAVDGALDVTPLIIDRSGRLLSPAATRRVLGAPAATAAGAEGGDAALSPPAPVPGENLASAFARLRDQGFDVVFPLLHGPYGEDGSVQGLLRLSGLPFVGSDVLGSAVAMDKLMMKAVFAAHGFAQVGYGGVGRAEWRRDRAGVIARLSELAWPRFVKPANLGSSIGVRRVETRGALDGAIDAAFAFDRRVIVEEGVEGARELEVAVLGNDAPVASPPGEIRFASEFYDYDTKYTDGRSELLIPAPVPADTAERARRLALRAFAVLDAAGLARVDFLYREADGALFLNELNTIPGFTRHSMYPKLVQAMGIGYGELIERLVTLACETR